ncbi:MAG: hypothetical protein KDK89_07850 [Alphaproteobacteria bacterium]|nr:hypothetical protein [Alphaproteobacteria bacterium]
MRPAIAVLAFLMLSAPALALDFEPNAQGQIEFMMPSGNIGCIYTPAGGTDVYEPVGGGPELSCDRVEPSYMRVTLGPHGKARRFGAVGDATCCGSENIFDYRETWDMDGFHCASSTTGLKCRRGSHGFIVARKSVKTW